MKTEISARTIIVGINIVIGTNYKGALVTILRYGSKSFLGKMPPY